MGLKIVSAQKGPDSVKYGIQSIREKPFNVTTNSLNTIKELRNYSYQQTRDGKYIEKPVDKWNHSIDAMRYGITHLYQRPNFVKENYTKINR
ncbi:MAG: hypothetical protein KAI29_03225 [Cyclobacteriaceae bacterium]|nr:hypothetical protein [Cyclobacteriaceae bacterium]